MHVNTHTQTHLHEGLCLFARFPGYEMISIPLAAAFPALHTLFMPEVQRDDEALSSGVMNHRLPQIKHAAVTKL